MTFRAAWLWVALAAAACGSTTSLAGRTGETWEGQIMVPGAPVIVTVRLDDPTHGTMDVRHRPLREVPIRVVTRPGSSTIVLVSESPQAPVWFFGERNGTDIRGTFREQGRSYPFWLTRT